VGSAESSAAIKSDKGMTFTAKKSFEAAANT